MTWKEIRRHYQAILAAKKQGEGLTQETVATRGGLKQNGISKMLANENLGPQVETFVRAVEGLGLSVSDFFADLEGRSQDRALQSAQRNVKKTIPQSAQESSHGRPVSPIDSITLRDFIEFLYTVAAAQADAERSQGLDRPTAGARPDKTTRR